MVNYVAYVRVSTAKQGQSGLGLEAQLAAVTTHVNCHGKLLATYREVESGRNCERPELAKAIAHAKRTKAILVVAKMDRLSRNVAFLAQLMESGLEFVVCDNPHANKLTVWILASIAQHEAEMTSTRTKQALAALKARGVKLGSAREGHWDGREDKRLAGLAKATEKAAKANRKLKAESYSDILPMIQELRTQGVTFQEIANKLNELGHSTRRGKRWGHVQVMRLLSA